MVAGIFTTFSEMNFSPLPVLTTQRLLLRQLLPEDARKLSALRSDKAVNKYLDRLPETSIEAAGDFILYINEGIKTNSWLYWAICIKGTDTLIGTVCIWNFSDDKTIAEIGYELFPMFQGRGYMHEALQCVIANSFDVLHLKVLEAHTHKDNKKSLHLLLKNNFTIQAERSDSDNPDFVICTLNSGLLN